MALGIIDVREWQTTFDLRSGKKCEDDSRLACLAREITARHTYPGDLDPEANAWVTDTALDLIEGYEPGFAFLSYAQPHLALRFGKVSDAKRRDMLKGIFAEIERFVSESGFVPVVVGSGQMVPLQGYMDLSTLDGLASSSNWAARYVGIYQASSGDLRYIRELPHVERIVSSEEWLEELDGDSPLKERLPDYLLVAREGYTFKASGASLRSLAHIPAANNTVPVHCPVGKPSSLTDIHGLVLEALEHQKIALIMVEGIGADDFGFPSVQCKNGKGWFTYEPGEAQYITITTGEHQVFNYPPGYRYYLEDDEKREFPFSGYFSSLPENTLGHVFSGRSISVGNRSMFMHVASGADISVECYARVLYNHGVMAVVHPERGSVAPGSCR